MHDANSAGGERTCIPTGGIEINGIRVYSSQMAKALKTGTNNMPIFAELEVSGTGTGEKLAGNVSSEYLMNEDGSLEEF